MTAYFDAKAKTWDSASYRQERAKTIGDSIKDETRLPAGYKGMDFGCGTGLLGFQFAREAGEFTFLDTSEGMIGQVRKKIEEAGMKHVSAVVRDITQDEMDASYDLIVTLMALHHVDDYEGTIQKLGTFLSPGGYLCIADLVTEDGSFHHDQTVPHNGFDPDVIEEILRTSGLQPLSRSTPFENRRIVNGVERRFPILLSVARKPEG